MNLVSLRCAADYPSDSISGELQRVDLSSNLRLQTLDLSSNKLMSVVFPASPDLYKVNLSYNSLGELNFPEGNRIEDLSVQSNPNLRRLDLPSLPELKYLNREETPLVDLDFSGCPKLTKYVAYNDKIVEEYDFSHNPH
ncbi:MAG: hypothetical protein ACI4TJ_07070 [Candidatus Cryptobacteroides sp.]